MLHFSLECCNKIWGKWCHSCHSWHHNPGRMQAANLKEENRITTTSKGCCLSPSRNSFLLEVTGWCWNFLGTRILLTTFDPFSPHISKLWTVSSPRAGRWNPRCRRPARPGTSRSKTWHTAGNTHTHRIWEFSWGEQSKDVTALRRHWPVWASMGCRGMWQSSRTGQRWWWRPPSRWEHMARWCSPPMLERNRTPDSPSPTRRQPAGSRLWTEDQRDHREGDVSWFNRAAAGLTRRPERKAPEPLGSVITRFE